MACHLFQLWKCRYNWNVTWNFLMPLQQFHTIKKCLSKNNWNSLFLFQLWPTTNAQHRTSWRIEIHFTTLYKHTPNQCKCNWHKNINFESPLFISLAIRWWFGHHIAFCHVCQHYLLPKVFSIVVALVNWTQSYLCTTTISRSSEEVVGWNGQTFKWTSGTTRSLELLMPNSKKSSNE